MNSSLCLDINEIDTTPDESEPFLTFILVKQSVIRCTGNPSWIAGACGATSNGLSNKIVSRIRRILQHILLEFLRSAQRHS